MKKLISLTLALVMIVACLAGLAVAADPIAKVTTGTTTVEVETVADMVAAVDPSGNSVITLLKDIENGGIIKAPYTCTLDMNGHTIHTTKGNTWDVAGTAVGTENAISVVKNGTFICDQQQSITVRKGGMIVENVKGYSLGYGVCYNEVSTEYNDVNVVKDSTFISLNGGGISFNFADAPQTGAKVRVVNTKLISPKESGVSVIESKKGGGIVVLDKGVEMYSYKPDSWLTSKMTAEGETVKAEFNLATVEVAEFNVKYPGMSYWHTPEYVAPAQPETPAAPATPTTPATPSVPTTGTPDVTTPATGVSVVALGVMAMVSLAGAVITKKH